MEKSVLNTEQVDVNPNPEERASFLPLLLPPRRRPERGGRGLLRRPSSLPPPASAAGQSSRGAGGGGTSPTPSRDAAAQGVAAELGGVLGEGRAGAAMAAW